MLKAASLYSAVKNFARFTKAISTMIVKQQIRIDHSKDGIHLRITKPLYMQITEDVSVDCTKAIHSNSTYFIVTTPLPMGLTPTELGDFLRTQQEQRSKLTLQTHHAESHVCKGETQHGH